MNLAAATALQNGKYVLDTQLGNGVFETTYRATERESGQAIVIKSLGENLRQHPEFDQFKQQFLEFAERLSHCKHQNLVQILDYFEEAGRPYWVMEYIPGETLAALVEPNVLSEAKALDYIRQTSNALSVLHKAGLLHRDVKPQNLIRRQDTDCVVLCEFGITCEFTAGVMQTQANLLSAGYAPPEYYSLEAQRPIASDIYALAATLYCLLLGRPPLPAVVRQALQSSKSDRLFPPELQQHTRKLSPTVKQALWEGLAISTQQRPQTVEAWLALLPNPEKRPTIQPTPAQIPLAKSQPGTGVASLNTAVNGSPTSTSKTFQPSIQANGSTPPPTLTQVGNQSYLVPPKRKFAQSRLPLKALIMTSAIATSVGVGFGFALRINKPHEPGSTIFHTEQSFPPSSNWPMSNHQL